MAISCPHCSAPNADAAAFCASCGKALPTGLSATPRVVGSEQFAATDAGVALQDQTLKKESKKAVGALAAVAILQTIGAIIIFALLQNNPAASSQAGAILAVMLVLAAIFAALSFWARSSPLPAAIVGLVLFVTVHLIDAVASGGVTLAQGIIVKIIVIVVLIRAIQAGVKHKELRTRMGVR
ncbi:MAG: zinc ribbon domain-containing protein [Phycisphaerae bacterium]|nr:zinc ribbon domain-containing protein [Phycisphaerae bacterium]